MAYRIVQFITRLIAFITARIDIDGLEKIPRTGGVIVASNHIGRLEVLLVYAILPRRDVIMIAAEKYRKNVFWRWLGKQLNVIWVERFNADLHAVREVMKRLQHGEIFCVAPEGTRSKTESLQTGRPGTAYLASKAGVPIIPVGITGTEDRIVWGNLRRLRRTQVRVLIGNPLVVPPLRGKEREAELQHYTDEVMCQIAALLPETHRGVYAGHPRVVEIIHEGFQPQRPVEQLH
jgi:1-acyl-sn-glycerol-3-phosphate acyltransferase